MIPNARLLIANQGKIKTRSKLKKNQVLLATDQGNQENAVSKTTMGVVFAGVVASGPLRGRVAVSVWPLINSIGISGSLPDIYAA